MIVIVFSISDLKKKYYYVSTMQTTSLQVVVGLMVFDCMSEVNICANVCSAFSEMSLILFSEHDSKSR